MPDWKIFLLLFIAIATGWLLGKLPVKKLWQRYRNRRWHQSYLQGIHLLLNEQPDQAIETYIKAWRVNSDNFELHNALANMLRRKGEVDRALRIHANLVESDKLPPEQIHQATLELANDYISAGLLDRAERLLINVVNNSKTHEERSLELLQQIYQTEKEWEKAITVAEQLLPNRRVEFDSKILSSGRHHIEIAHYYCEIAEKALAEHHYAAAENALERALHFYPDCARASMLKASLYIERDDKESALGELSRLPEQDPQLLIEALPLYQKCYEHEPEKLLLALKEILKNFPSMEIIKTIFEIENEIDPFEANQFLQQYVKKRPTLQGLDMLINEQLDILQGAARENLELLHQLVRDVLNNKSTHHCRECGFSGMQMHWLCPKCLSWDSIRRIRGSEGD